MADNSIKVFEVDVETIIKSQSGLLDDKNHNVNPSLFLAKALGNKIPDYGITITNPGWKKLVKFLKNQVRLAVLRKMSASDRFFTIIHTAGRIRRKVFSFFDSKIVL
jgi:hypothetical protein